MPSAVFSILYLFFVVILPVFGSGLLFLDRSLEPARLNSENTGHLPDLSDDMEDGLSSGSNIESLKEIMECLTDLVRRWERGFYLKRGYSSWRSDRNS